VKIRQGFVSNSSSSSFVISKKYLSEDQINKLIQHTAGPIGSYQDSWDVSETPLNVYGNTYMENCVEEGEGGLHEWMKDNNFPMDVIKWDEDN